ncbi:tRNA lysidine(34) synthetase TilS [Flavicella sp.]|uniref:tRNA lysidine(34) synthetase TilS n=1 Tax=Flavicella sp. TaxID=2957742 RepID=UPI00301A339C
MLKRFQKHLDKNFPCLYKSKLLIACSGGLDSTVLAHLFQKSNFNFSLAHCNFTLRAKESDKDESFVKNLGSFLNCNVYSIKFKTNEYANENKLSIQMAARELRYSWFEKIVKKHKLNYTLTAHHKDDVLETFLINFTRGTGLDGLTGIPEVNGHVIRPLLPFTRKEIQDYAEKNKILWREDVSNSSIKYFRNKIRHQIVPLLKELNPNFFKSFDNTLNNLQDSKTLVQERIDELNKKLISKNKDGTLSISIPEILNLKDIKANIYEILKPFGFINWKDINSILKAQTGKQLISKSHRLLKNRDELIISSIEKVTDTIYEIPEKAKSISKPIPLKFKNVEEPEKFSNNKAYIDKEKLNHTLHVRKWKKGDYFYPIGMNGKKKLSNFFKDSKMSLLEKEATWLLCDGDHIVWIIGNRMDNRYKITSKTISILEITLVI